MPKKGLLLWMLFGMAIMVSSCSKDEEKDSCTNFTTSDKELTVNGNSELISVAQQLISAGFDGNIYQMQIATVSSDCNELHTINLNIEIPAASKLNGTYKIVDFLMQGWEMHLELMRFKKFLPSVNRWKNCHRVQ
ncbi:MAG: hypothetical protein IPH36_19560 [Saprospiraceae bacterium]|nr:hypothetical protein [Saprospiraceae bacterium]